MIGSYWRWSRKLSQHQEPPPSLSNARLSLPSPASPRSLPYILRLRQCMHEYLIPANTSSRPLLNALKYASAFPVIFLSAAQRTVVQQVAQDRGLSVEELRHSSGRWFGEHRLFRLW